jgi:thymidylate synthase
MPLIKAHCAGVAHELAVNAIFKHPRYRPTPYGETIECDPIYIKIENPLEESTISPKSNLKMLSARGYAKQIIEGTQSTFEYDYHERLFNHQKMDQIMYIKEKISKDKHTRRAVAITWIPEKDWFSEHVPCLQLLQCDVESDNKLHMKVVFRSNDMLEALGMNMYGFIQLQKTISESLGYKQGSYIHISLIPHIYYKRDVDDLSKMVGLPREKILETIEECF